MYQITRPKDQKAYYEDDTRFPPRCHLITFPGTWHLPLTELDFSDLRLSMLMMTPSAKGHIDLSEPPASRFVPNSNEKPEVLFQPRNCAGTPSATRYIHKHHQHVLLIQTDGACSNNGHSNARAGWAFVTGPQHPNNAADTGIISGELEGKDATSNRAEMIAVLSAIRARHWPGEGFHTIVFATDSEYVVKGCTEWVRRWEAEGWAGRANADLWQEMVFNLERWKYLGLDVMFWLIPREWNDKADQAAKRKANAS